MPGFDFGVLTVTPRLSQTGAPCAVVHAAPSTKELGKEESEGWNLGCFDLVFPQFHKNHPQLCTHLEGHPFLILQRYMRARGGSYDNPITLLLTLTCRLAWGICQC